MNHKQPSIISTFYGWCSAVVAFLFWAGFLAVLSGLAGATAAGFFGHLHWRLDLFSHFRMQYLMVAIGLLVIPLMGRKRWLSGATAAVGLANLLVLLPFLSLTPTAEAGGETLRIVSANVLYHNETPEQILAFIHETDPDIVFLAEMTQSHRAVMAELWELYPYTADSGQSNIILSRVPIESSVVDRQRGQRPNVLARLNYEGQSFTVMGVHTQTPMNKHDWQRRNSHLQHLATLVQQETNPVIVVGDFNISPYSPNFSAFLEAGGLENGRIHQGINTTWPNINPLLRIPIDHFVATAEIIVQHLEAGRFVGSDHRPLVIDFTLGARE